MKINMLGLVAAAAWSVSGVGIGACATSSAPESEAEIGAALELQNGGYDTEDEAPAFADEAAFEEAESLDGDVAVDDDMRTLPDVVSDPCNHGYLVGRWHRRAPGRGVYIGRVLSSTGARIGHVRGIYGVRRNGDKVFFGKYIALGGEFRGILAGTYDEGRFAGRWLDRHGDHGAIGGVYNEGAGPRIAGHFAARWAERTCTPATP